MRRLLTVAVAALLCALTLSRQPPMLLAQVVPSPAGYVTVQDEGSAVARRKVLNFIGTSVACVDNSGSGRTDCTITGGVTLGGSAGELQFNDGGTALGGVTGSIVTSNRLVELVAAAGGQLCLRDATATFGSSCEIVLSTGARSEFSSLGYRTGTGVLALQHDNGSSRTILGYLTSGTAQWMFSDSGVIVSLNKSSGSGGKFCIDARSVGAFVACFGEDGSNWHHQVEDVTSTKTTTLAESAECYTNVGDTDGTTFTLLDNPTKGAHWCFAVVVAQTMTIVPSSGEQLWYNGAQCVTSLASNDDGATVEIKAVTGGSGAKYFSFGPAGTWSCT